ncbi:F-box only protein 16 [Gadus chalcogrammus]|uniref:F-box only protein 16 n=1 Tax=Gadus chalcogrammus TaxID=1042646 RepID=UPI0024C479BC|nr:F-box only protein 16 [Gadus chalcogrammus]
MASLGSSKLQTKMSAWTPLNHPVANGKVFSERRTLLVKWFDKWSEGQRKCVLQDFLSRCSAVQLRFVSSSLERQLPLQAVDFTCMLPRVLSLFIFSYLDPRSLCRCATVSWHWRGIVELDLLWMPKCVRLAWTLPFSPTPYETSVWKRLYVETVRMLRCTAGPQTPCCQAFIVPEVTAIRSATPNPIEQALFDQVRLIYTPQQARDEPSSRRSLEAGEGQQPGLGLPPWRHADRHPKDTQRFNYLSNLDPVDQAKQAQMRGSMDSVRKPLTAGSYKLRKAKSQPSQTRPDWATPTPSSCDPHVTMASRAASAQWNAGIRPGPVRPAVPRLSVEALRASQRTSRSPPSVPLFESQPWISLDHRTPNLHPLLE